MKSALIVLFVSLCLAAYASAQSNGPKMTVDISQTNRNGPRGPSREQSFKVTQDAWVSKNGNWRAGGYVQHDRFKQGGQNFKDTHGGVQVSGRF